MPLKSLDHINIRTANLEAMVAWYSDVLGVAPGPRPDFTFPGAWLYLGETAVIHLIGVETAPAPGDDLRLEHFSFRASGHGEFLARLDAGGIPHDSITVDAVGLTLVNVHDPDGNHIHVDFPINEAG